MAKKLCELCGQNPATVPDRNRMGRPINRVCGTCHGIRLAGDFQRILAIQAERRSAIREQTKEGEDRGQ